MNFPWVNLAAIIVGGVLAAIGGIMLLVAAFRQSLRWGLTVLLAPLGKILFTFLYWEKAKTGFLTSIVGVVILLGGFCSIPEVQADLWKATDSKSRASAPGKNPNLDSQILEHRQQLETLQAAFARDGAELTKQYQLLDAQRKALKSTDAAAITKFNEVAATYQARTAARKQMQQHIEITQRELDSLLDTRARSGAPSGLAKKG